MEGASPWVWHAQWRPGDEGDDEDEHGDEDGDEDEHGDEHGGDQCVMFSEENLKVEDDSRWPSGYCGVRVTPRRGNSKNITRYFAFKKTPCILGAFSPPTPHR